MKRRQKDVLKKRNGKTANQKILHTQEKVMDTSLLPSSLRINQSKGRTKTMKQRKNMNQRKETRIQNLNRKIGREVKR